MGPIHCPLIEGPPPGTRPPGSGVALRSARPGGRPRRVERRVTGLGWLLPLVLLGLARGAHGAVVDLVIEPPVSHDGVYQLSWSAPGDVLLEESTDSSFDRTRIVYEGADRGTVLTGRRDGRYHYRLRSDGAPASEAVTASVRVEHHPIGRALAFFGVGAFVFVSTIVLVARGPEGGPDGASDPGDDADG